MARERHALAASLGGLLLVSALLAACNAALGGGAVALLGGAGYLAAQCYDRVQVKVRDPAAGSFTCEADVTISDGDSERSLRPCYTAALTSGSYRVTARLPGYVPASSELEIADHEGDCPHYTHSIELTLRSESASPAAPTVIAPREPPAPAAPASSPAAPVPPEPQPAPVPTRTFEDLAPSADAGAPN